MGAGALDTTGFSHTDTLRVIIPAPENQSRRPAELRSALSGRPYISPGQGLFSPMPYLFENTEESLSFLNVQENPDPVVDLRVRNSPYSRRGETRSFP